MEKEIRSRFNKEFTQEKYLALLQDITSDFNYSPTFRIAETPFFIPKDLEKKLMAASQEVMSFIQRPDFKELTHKAIDLNSSVPSEESHTQFLAIDFGICVENGEILPKLIEVQVFPSIFNFQFNPFKKFEKYYPF